MTGDDVDGWDFVVAAFEGLDVATLGDAAVDERGGIDMASTNNRLDTVAENTQMIANRLDRLLDLFDSGQPVSQRDILRALGVAVDRNGRF